MPFPMSPLAAFINFLILRFAGIIRRVVSLRPQPTDGHELPIQMPRRSLQCGPTRFPITPIPHSMFDPNAPTPRLPIPVHDGIQWDDEGQCWYACFEESNPYWTDTDGLDYERSRPRNAYEGDNHIWWPISDSDHYLAILHRTQDLRRCHGWVMNQIRISQSRMREICREYNVVMTFPPEGVLDPVAQDDSPTICADSPTTDADKGGL